MKNIKALPEIEKICAGSGSISLVKLDVEQKRLRATNDHILAIVKCDPDPNDLSLSIDPKSFSAARSDYETDTISVNHSNTMAVDDKSYPGFDRVFLSTEPVFTITIDSDLLIKLANALDMESTQLTMHIRNPAQGIVCVASNGNYGMIMPINPLRANTKTFEPIPKRNG